MNGFDQTSSSVLKFLSDLVISSKTEFGMTISWKRIFKRSSLSISAREIKGEESAIMITIVYFKTETSDSKSFES